MFSAEAAQLLIHKEGAVRTLNKVYEGSSLVTHSYKNERKFDSEMIAFDKIAKRRSMLAETHFCLPSLFTIVC